MKVLPLLVLLSVTSKVVFAQDTISIVVNPAVTGKTIAPDFAGVSFETGSLNKIVFSPGKDTLIQLFETLGLQSLRVGGNSVDKDTLSAVATNSRFTTSEIDSLFLFARKAGCKIIMGLICGGDFNPSLAAAEASYIMQHYAGELTGFEVGNEADLYHSNGFRPSTYSVADYETEYLHYYDSVRHYYPAAPFTGPTSATDYNSFTLPFCRYIKNKILMLTQHYYVAAAYSAPIPEQIAILLSAAKLNSITSEVNALVQCADSFKIPFRMGECNSFYNGGQYGVSDAFASTLWALDYMYALALEGCAGVNFHGGLGGPYTVVARQGSTYSARPIYYGILAFQLGSKGKFISSVVTNNHINLDTYSVLDSSNNIFTTIINKDTTENAVIDLDAGNPNYKSAEYISLLSPSLRDTITVTLGGQSVNISGTIGAYNWQTLTVSDHKSKISVPAASAVIVKFMKNSAGVSMNEFGNSTISIYPNPTHDFLFVKDGTNSQVRILSLAGSLIEDTKFNGERIDVRNLASGVYILELRDSKNIRRVKFVKE